jgi:hypothetical protein
MPRSVWPLRTHPDAGPLFDCLDKAARIRSFDIPTTAESVRALLTQFSWLGAESMSERQVANKVKEVRRTLGVKPVSTAASMGRYGSGQPRAHFYNDHDMKFQEADAQFDDTDYPDLADVPEIATSSDEEDSDPSEDLDFFDRQDATSSDEDEDDENQRPSDGLGGPKSNKRGKRDYSGKLRGRWDDRRGDVIRAFIASEPLPKVRLCTAFDKTSGTACNQPAEYRFRSTRAVHVISACTQTKMHTDHAHTSTHTHPHPRTHPCTHAHSHTLTHTLTRTHTFTHALTRAHLHPCAYANIDISTHAQMQILIYPLMCICEY